MAANEQLSITFHAFDKSKQVFNGVHTNLNKVRQAAMNVRFAFVALSGAFAVKSILDSSVAFEKMTLGLKGATGSAEAGAKEYEYLRETVSRLALDLQSSGEAFTQLTAASRGTALEGQATRDAFEAISISSKVLGRSAADTHGVIYALQQMISKGKVTSEELRRQMGDRLPGAFQMAADAMDMTTQELDEAMKKGELYAEDFVPRFTKVLMDRFGSQLPAAMETTQSKINQLNTAWFDMKVAIAESGVVDVLKDTMDVLIEFGESDDFASFVEDLASSIRENKKDINTFLNDLTEYVGDLTWGLGKLIKGLGILKTFMKEGPLEMYKYGVGGGPAGIAYRYFMGDENDGKFRASELGLGSRDDGTVDDSIYGPGVWEKYARDQAARAKRIQQSIASASGTTIKDPWQTAPTDSELETRAQKTAEDLEKLRQEYYEHADKMNEYARDGEGLGDDIWLKKIKERAEVANRATKMAAQTTNEWLIGAKTGLDEYALSITSVTEEMETLTTAALSSIEDAFVELATTGKTSFKDMANSIIADLTRIMVRQNITGPLAGMLGGLFSSGVSGASNYFGGNIYGGATAGELSSFFSTNAVGNVYGPNGLQKFARGGVVNGPTLFPFANGTGLMGEAGPEAIMPLERVNGKLGVRAAGGGVNISQNFDLRGADESAIPRLTQAAEQIKQETLNAVRQSLSRGGEFHRLTR